MTDAYQPRLQLNRAKPVVTYAIIALNVLVFALDYLSSLLYGGELLTVLGAKVNSLILAGQYWRLVTPMFLHANFLHLMCNCFAIYIWGRNVEALLGKARYLAVYFASGIIGCAVSFAASPALSVGSSGAIFGLFGALLAFRKRDRALFNAVFGVQVLAIVVINLVNGFISPGIDNWGHIGGLLGGYVAGLAAGGYRDRLGWKNLLLAAALLLLLAGLLWLGRYRYLGY